MRTARDERRKTMITLDMEEYCHDCPNFEPEVLKDKWDEVVFCKYHETCHRFMTYLKSRLAKEKGDDHGRKV